MILSCGRGRQHGAEDVEGSGLGPDEVDIFNPYDGSLTFTQQFLEGFQWHGVGWGEAHDFYADYIRVEAPLNLGSA